MPASTSSSSSPPAALHNIHSGTAIKTDCLCGSAPTSSSRSKTPASSSHVLPPPPPPLPCFSSSYSASSLSSSSSFSSSPSSSSTTTPVLAPGPSASTVVQTIPPGPTTSTPPTSGGFFHNKGAVAGVFAVVGISVLSLASLTTAIIRRRRRGTRQVDGDVAEAVAPATTSHTVDPRMDDNPAPKREPGVAYDAMRHSSQNVTRGSPDDTRLLAPGIALTDAHFTKPAGGDRTSPPLGTSARPAYSNNRDEFTEPYSVEVPRTHFAPPNRMWVPKRQSAKRLQTNLNTYVKKHNLQKFYATDDPFVKTVAKNAAALAPNDPINTVDNIKHLTYLSLYQLVLYCDDSTSMASHVRYDTLRELVKRITSIATRIVPDNFGVELRFINSPSKSHISAAKIDGAMASVELKRGTNIGTNLREKVLRPLVYDVLADSRRKLERPLLICAITDGMPNPEPPGTFKEAILECREMLMNSGYKPNVVMFCVSQIGDSGDSTEFLEGLRGDKEIEDVLYCTTDRLDKEYKELKGSEDRLEEWLLKTLTTPIMQRNQE